MARHGGRAAAGLPGALVARHRRGGHSTEPAWDPRGQAAGSGAEPPPGMGGGTGLTPCPARRAMLANAATMRILIKGGKVVNDDCTLEADVYIENGIIQQVGRELMIPGGAKVIDATGKLVIPGGIDTSTHFHQTFMNATCVDDFYHGTKVPPGTALCSPTAPAPVTVGLLPAQGGLPGPAGCAWGAQIPPAGDGSAQGSGSWVLDQPRGHADGIWLPCPAANSGARLCRRSQPCHAEPGSSPARPGEMTLTCDSFYSANHQVFGSEEPSGRAGSQPCCRRDAAWLGHGAAHSRAPASAACPQLCPAPSGDGRDLVQRPPGHPWGPQQPQCSSRGAVGLAVPSTGCRCPCAPHTAGIVQGWCRPCLALGWGCWVLLCHGTARGQCGDRRHPVPCLPHPTRANC